MTDNPLEKFEKALTFYKNESLRFKDLIDTAKTGYKKKYYKEKLKANNTQFARYLYMYDKIKNGDTE